MDLDEVADELYGLRPEEFTSARNDRAQQARSEGQRDLAAQIRGLRRPTLAAWASNLLVREQQEEVAPLLRLGEELRGAHRNLDGQELRSLSHQQHQLVAALSRQAAQLAADSGQPLGPQAQQEVAQTLQAVMSDPDAAREWAAGRLAKPLSVSVGFDAAAREASGAQSRGGGAGAQEKRPAPARAARRTDGTARGKGNRTDERTRDAEERARRDAREAADRAEELRQEAESASEDAEAARAALEEAEERLTRLREELRQAEREHSRCRKSEREAVRTAREARHRAEQAGKRAQRLSDAAPSAGAGRSSGGGAGRGGRRR